MRSSRRSCLQRFAAEIDWSTLEPTPTAFTDPSLSQTESDLSFRVKCRGVLLHVILLFEHQSSDDPAMAFRLLRYMVRIWEGESVPLPPIVPVVLHHSEAGWRSATTFHDLVALGPLAGTGIEALVPSFRFVLDDVSRQSDEAVAARVEDALVRLALSVLRDARAATDGAALVRRLGGLLKDVHRSEGLRAAYGKVLRYLLTVVPTEPRPFLDALASEVGPDAKEEAMGMLEKARDEGILKGMQQGMQQGIAEGQLAARRETLERLIVRKLGPLPEKARAAIAAMDRDALDAALERLLTAARIDDVVPG